MKKTTSIIIAEDSQSTRLALKTVLEFHDFNVVAEAKDGDEAVEAYKRTKPDLVLMDIAMPKKHGVDAINEIMAFDADARIIAITALYSPEKRHAALESGAVGVIEKPFDVPDLIKTIKATLNQAGDRE